MKLASVTDFLAGMQCQGKGRWQVCTYKVELKMTENRSLVCIVSSRDKINQKALQFAAYLGSFASTKTIISENLRYTT